MKNHAVAGSALRARLQAFIQLSRLKFLTGGVLGFALGALVARYEGYPLDAGTYALGQLMVTSFHLMVHYANDYFDRFCDARAERTPWSGGSGILQNGAISPSVALGAALACAGIGILGIVAFALRGNGTAAAAGIACGLLGWIYSAPPVRLLARGWGELNAALLVGVIFPLTGYVAFAPSPSPRLLATTLPSLAAMFVLMFCVEYPDVEVDRATGKLNLVAKRGRAGSRMLVYSAVAAIYVGGAVALAFGAPPSLAVFLALTAPLGWSLCLRLTAAADAEIAARGVAMFVVTILGSALAYLSVL